MKLIVGLGNPEPKYELTRHNLGFRIVSEIRNKYADSFTDFTENKKFQSLVSEGTLGNEKILLSKPLTYMNNSGQAVKLLKKFYHLELSDIWIVHDDLDLEPGKTKISFSSSSAGHNGITSVITALDSNEFYRWRIGIGHPPSECVEQYVLEAPPRAEEELIDAAAKKILEGIELACREHIANAQNKLNQKQ